MKSLMSSNLRRALVAAASVLALAATGFLAFERFGPERRHTIANSYYFDVTDRRYVAGFSDAVVVIEVDRLVSTDKNALRTTFEGTVTDEYTEYLSDDKSIRFDQVGFRDGRHLHESEDQQLLEVGSTYVVALREKQEAPGEYGVVGGPLSVVRVADVEPQNARIEGPTAVANAADLEQLWRDAIDNATDPPGVPG